MCWGWYWEQEEMEAVAGCVCRVSTSLAELRPVLVMGLS